MYLSRMILNPRSQDVRADLSDAQRLHSRVLAGFPPCGGGSPRAAYSVLFRLDLEPQTGRPSLLVQSGVEPDWTGLPTGYLNYNAPVSLACKSLHGLYDLLQTGDHLSFRLRANPTRRTSGSDSRVGKRVAILGGDAQIEWLHRKGEQGGFSLRTVRAQVGLPEREMPIATPGVYDVLARDATLLRGWKRRAEQQHNLIFGSVLFDGDLRITDVQRFREALVQGIGSGKAYGFGLLSIAPSA